MNEIKNRLIYKIHDSKLRKYATQFFKGSLIDIGCGNKPYKSLLKDLVEEHIGVDTEQTIHNKNAINIFSTAYKIPVEDCLFDSAICTAVLEHLEEPELAIRECYRILKPGGYAIYTVPFIWHLHEEPRDFFRFSKYGLKYLFEKSGFNIINIDPLSGFWITFGTLLIYNLYRFNRGPLRWLHLIDLTALILSKIFLILEKIDKTEQWTWMYMIIVKK
jgi:SAM-dependent methyltransferase